MFTLTGKVRCCLIRVQMGRDAQASTRLPSDLKQQVQEIATKEHRTLSGTIELLLRRGAAQYRKDGRLVEGISNVQLAKDEAENEAFAREFTDKIMKVVEARLDERERAAKPSKKRKRA
jgi:hypothetical protein